MSGTNVTSKFFEILFEMPSDSRCTSIGTTSKIKQIFLTLALYVNQNESKNLCTFQRTFEIENISTNENISVNENIVIMLLKKVHCRKLHASHFMCKFRFILHCIQTMSLIWSKYINYVVLLFC